MLYPVEINGDQGMAEDREPRKAGDWLVEPQLNQLSRDDEAVRVEPRSMDVLWALLDRDGEVATKDELLRAAWNGQAVSDDALTHAIWELRKALGDNARSPVYIQTVPKRGYRWIAGVEPATARGPAERSAATDPGAEPAQGEASTRIARRTFARSARWWGPAVLVALALAFGWQRFAPVKAERPSLMIRGAVSSCRALCGEAEAMAATVEGELANRLGALPGLELVSRDTARRFRGQPIRQIAARGAADYLVDFEIRELAGRAASPPSLGVTLELVATATDDALLRQAETLRDLSAARISALSYRLAEAMAEREPEALADLQAFEDFLSLVNSDGGRALGRSETASGSTAAGRAYARGVRQARLEDFDWERLERTAELFEYVVRQEPTFAQAWIWIVKIRALLSFNGYAEVAELRSLDAALDQARTHGASERDLRVAEGYLAYYGERDFERALGLVAGLAHPGSSDLEALRLSAFLQRRLGRFEQSIDSLQRSLALDPENGGTLYYLAETQAALRRFGEADESYRRALELEPSNALHRGEAALNRFDLTGSIAEAQGVLDRHPHPNASRLLPYSMQLLLYERQLHTARMRLAAAPLPTDPIVRFQTSWLSVVALDALGLDEDARLLANETREFMEEQVRRKPAFDFYSAYLALTYAFVGREDDARREIDRALELAADDRFSGPRIDYFAAQVHALLGEPEPAFDILRRLLALDYQRCLTVEQLRADPFWDRWRDHPSLPRR